MILLYMCIYSEVLRFQYGEHRADACEHDSCLVDVHWFAPLLVGLENHSKTNRVRMHATVLSVQHVLGLFFFLAILHVLVLELSQSVIMYVTNMTRRQVIVMRLNCSNNVRRELQESNAHAFLSELIFFDVGLRHTTCLSA